MTPALASVSGRSLTELLLGVAPFTPAEERLVGHFTLDSRQVAPGTLFAATSGAQRHGLEFVEEVLQQGAVAIL
ncbi:MAG TPA: Mur ligase domain-containing protein, partial [Gammaproteobacteria bacterium]|nr:Mur ligase domain-containing protein [Gammaproteobacteria bacterium]